MKNKKRISFKLQNYKLVKSVKKTTLHLGQNRVDFFLEIPCSKEVYVYQTLSE